jgi:hypothetical protein
MLQFWILQEDEIMSFCKRDVFDDSLTVFWFTSKKNVNIYIYAITLLAGVFLKCRNMEMISSLHRHCHIIYTLLFRKWKHVFLLLNVLFFLDSFFHGFQTHVSSPTAISGWIYFISFCSRNLNNLKFMKILLFLWPFWLFFYAFSEL